MEPQNSFDQFCPVYYEIPCAEIFQCKHGHTICSNCFKLVCICPQCWEPFVEGVSRCLILEKILNCKKFDCPNKEIGCEVKTSRQDMPEHSAGCLYRETSARLFQNLGYKCEYVVYSTKPKAALIHFKTVHDVYCHEGSSGKIILDSFLEATINKTNVWSPVIFKDVIENSSNTETFLVAAKTNGSKQTTSFVGVLLCGQGKSADDFAIQFVISADCKQMRSLQCTNALISLSHAETFLNAPYIQIPRSLLSTHYSKENTLEVSLSITRNATTNEVANAGPETTPVVICDTVEDFNEESISTRLGELYEAKFEGYVNYGVSFDECGARNFKGTRHDCLQCQNFDMCDACKKLGKHSHHLLVLVQGWSETVTLRKLKFDIITGEWKPLLSADVIVDNYDICSECNQNEGTNPIVGICTICLPFYGLCRGCFINGKMKSSCVNHNWWFYER